MKVKMQGHQLRKQRSKEFWMQVAADYNAGIPAEEIARRYANPNTGKNYTRQHIYWILRRVKQL